MCANKKPHELMASQSIGIGLPVLVPLDKDPRHDRFLMDQLADEGARTILGLAALNGEMLAKAGNATSPAKGLLAQISKAYDYLSPVMAMLRPMRTSQFTMKRSMAD